MKRCIIVNPKAGAFAQSSASIHEQLDRLQPAEVYVTEEAGRAEGYARRAAAAGFEEIISAGGDGTLNQIVNGVARHFDRVRIGVLPLGTGNDFARSLGLPTALSENIDVVLAGATEAIDIVRARSQRARYFANVSAGGFSGLVNEKLTPKLKKTWGPLAYLRSAAAALPNLRGYRTAVELDDATVDVDLYNVIIANGRYVAGGLPIAPEADVKDGQVDVVLIPARPAAEMMMLVAQILLGKHLHNEAITFRRARRVTVRSSPGMWFNVDGELVGNEPITFEVMPRVLQFLVRST